MSDETTRQELEDLCVDSLTCELEADTETGEKPCIGCEDFAAASGEVTVEEEAPSKSPHIIPDDDFKQLKAELARLDLEESEVDQLFKDHKEAKKRLEATNDRIIGLNRRLVGPQKDLWAQPNAEPEVLDDALFDEEGETWVCGDCGHQDIRANLLLPEDETQDGWRCPDCDSRNVSARIKEQPAAEATTEVALDEPGDDADTPEGDGGGGVL